MLDDWWNHEDASMAEIIDTQNMSAKLSSVSVDEDALNLSAAPTPPAMPAPMILYI